MRSQPKTKATLKLQYDVQQKYRKMEEILQCYALLGIQHTATPEEIKKAYRNMVKIWHPDRYINNLVLKAKAEVEIKKINRAYATIKADPTDRIGRVAKQNEDSSNSKVVNK